MSRDLMMRAAGANYAEVQRLQAEIDRLRAENAELRKHLHQMWLMAGTGIGELTPEEEDKCDLACELLAKTAKEDDITSAASYPESQTPE